MIKVPFYKYESSRDVHSNVSDVLDDDKIDQVSELESDFISYTGAEHALATSHGTSALHLAMLALDLKRGDKIICSVNTHPNVPEVVRHFDAEPIFIDIDVATYNINLDKVEAYLQENKSKKLKAVIVTHMAGQCCDLNKLYTIAKANNVKVVEDASEALGATYNGKKIGSTGADITCFDFSTHLKKNICNGGMLVSDSKEIIQRAKLIGLHAMQRDEESLSYIYDVVDIGYDYTMSQLDAAYIRAQIKEQDENLKRVKEIANIYNEALKSVQHVAIPEIISDEHSFSLYIIKIDKNRDSFALELNKQGVEVGLHYIPLHFLTYYKNKYMLKINNFPVALTSYQQVMSLPIYPSMSDKDIKLVIDKVKSVSSTRV
jgi:dTDP-4-amino-4,6-dideoxygalactose transaminase